MKTLNRGLSLIVLFLFLGACARTVPGQPLEVKVEKTVNGHILLTWKDNSQGELEEDKFVVQRALDTEDFKDLADVEKNTSTTNVLIKYEDKTVTITETYRYRVGAVIKGKAPIFSQEAKYDPNSSNEKVSLTVYREGGGTGVITSSPAGINCNHSSGVGCSAQFAKGSTVTLTATPEVGSALFSWSSECKPLTDNPRSCNIVMSAAKQVTETLIEAEPGLNVDVSGNGRVFDGVTDGSGPYIDCSNNSGDCKESVYWQVGNTVDLYAELLNDSSLVIWNGCDVVKDSKELPNGHCVVTLKELSVVQAVFLSPSDKPVIEEGSFTATPDKFPTGQTGPVTFAWKIIAPNKIAVTKVRLYEESKVVCESDKINEPDTCTVPSASAETYKLVVEGPFEDDPLQELKISFGDKPTVDLNTTHNIIAIGDSAVLSWAVSGSDANRKIILDGGIFDNQDVTLDSDNQIPVSPVTTTKYTVIVTNDFGMDTADVTIIVGDKPKIISFTALPSTITPGETVTLSWNVTGETKLTLDPIGIVTGNGTTDQPAVDTTYTLRATNDFGETVSEPIPVRVGNAPVIASFTVNKDAVETGGSVKLSWDVNGAGSGLVVKLRRNGDVINADAGRTGSFNDGPLNDKGTVTYTLSASNDFGSAVPASLKVDVGDPPVIDTLAAEPPFVEEGKATRIFWSGDFEGDVGDGDKLTLNPGRIDVTGKLEEEVTPSAPSTTYELIAENKFGFVTETIIVDVFPAAPPEPPVISRFRAKPSKIDSGESTTLEWQIGGTPPITLTLDNGSGPVIVTGDNETVSPSETTTYTLTATNDVDSVTKTVTVTVRQPPDIRSFLGVPTEILFGESTTLSWDVFDEDSLSLSPGGAVSGDNITVTPSDTTIYTLTATNTVGSVSSTPLTITVLPVAPPDPPIITNFTALPEIIPKGSSSTLEWEVAGTPPIVLTLDDGSGAVEVTGKTLAVFPVLTTTYTLKALNIAGEDTKTQVVTVGDTPTITSFTATPDSILTGEISTLAWVVEGNEPITLSLDQGVGDVSSLDKIDVTPALTTVYTLSASNLFGTTSSQVTLTVNP